MAAWWVAAWWWRYRGQRPHRRPRRRRWRPPAASAAASAAVAAAAARAEALARRRRLPAARWPRRRGGGSGLARRACGIRGDSAEGRGAAARRTERRQRLHVAADFGQGVRRGAGLHPVWFLAVAHRGGPRVAERAADGGRPREQHHRAAEPEAAKPHPLAPAADARHRAVGEAANDRLHQNSRDWPGQPRQCERVIRNAELLQHRRHLGVLARPRQPDPKHGHGHEQQFRNRERRAHIGAVLRKQLLRAGIAPAAPRLLSFWRLRLLGGLRRSRSLLCRLQLFAQLLLDLLGLEVLQLIDAGVHGGARRLGLGGAGPHDRIDEFRNTEGSGRRRGAIFRTRNAKTPNGGEIGEIASATSRRRNARGDLPLSCAPAAARRSRLLAASRPDAASVALAGVAPARCVRRAG